MVSGTKHFKWSFHLVGDLCPVWILYKGDQMVGYVMQISTAGWDGGFWKPELRMLPLPLLKTMEQAKQMLMVNA